MLRFTIFLCVVFVFTSCKDDPLVDNEPATECLEDTMITQGFNDCSDVSLASEEEFIYIGSKQIPENVKSQYKDFCYPAGSFIMFENETGEPLESTIALKYYQTVPYSITALTLMKKYCLDAENAVTEIRSDKFTIEINLHTGLKIGTNEINADENICTNFGMFAKYQNSKQNIFLLQLTNHLDEVIEADTSRIRFHENILLNGVAYNNIYSNENNEANGLERNEKVYFSKVDGLVAVRDSLGVLWRRL